MQSQVKTYKLGAYSNLELLRKEALTPNGGPYCRNHVLLPPSPICGVLGSGVDILQARNDIGVFVQASLSESYNL